MSRPNSIVASGAAAFLVLASTTSTRAEEIENKFRLAFSIGSYGTTDQVHSSSGNRRTLFRPNGELEDQIYDPRNDSGAASDFGIGTSRGGVLSASYALNRLWYVEASAGYRRGTVGNVEVQAEFAGAPTTNTLPFNFAIYNLDGGTISQVPIQLTAGIRFRPKAAFNPYLCLGVGYTFNSFTPSDEINQLSISLDQSTGGFARLEGTLFGGESLGSAEGTANLSGITVDVRDAPEWHFGGGFEFSFKSRWVVFIDARYLVYSGKLGMTVNGSDELGISVPADRKFINEPGAFGPFGAFQITSGGLIDGGSLLPKVGHEGESCEESVVNCEFTGPPDGTADLGKYYIHAGKVRYDGASLQIGVKFTF